MTEECSSDGRPSRPRLIIHAGLGKSGSSAIQKFCRDHPDVLRAAGALYLGMYLERAAKSERDFTSPDDLQQALEDDPEIEARLIALLTSKIGSRPGVQTFVWSHIALAMHADRLGRVIAALQGVCDVEVILYFRHQASWLVSAYQQWGVKHKTNPGPIMPFAEWLPRAKAHGADYRAVIEQWQDAIGRMRLRVRSYDQTNDVVADFLRIAGLGPLPAEGASTRHYETPDPTIMTLYRLYQGQQDGIALPGALQRTLSANGLEQKRYREVSPASTLPTGPAWQEFVDSFAETNEGLMRDFGLKLTGASTEPPKDPSSAAPSTIVPALLDLILSMDRRITTLERRLKNYERSSATSDQVQK